MPHGFKGITHVSFEGDENVLEPDRGAGCTTLNALKAIGLFNVKMLNFMPCPCHLNKEKL